MNEIVDISLLTAQEQADILHLKNLHDDMRDDPEERELYEASSAIIYSDSVEEFKGAASATTLLLNAKITRLTQQVNNLASLIGDKL